jgi:hypothetical protein
MSLRSPTASLAITFSYIFVDREGNYLDCHI